MAQKPRVVITYCPNCHWLPRAAWMAQELLYTFAGDLEEVALRPSDVGGDYLVEVDNVILWDRRKDGGFPEIKTLKRLLRDRIAPDRPLGHIDSD
ncbi:MAG: selenoprotein [Porticoccaceae bacterium]|nr:selenoprotein [Porticoccaceae bacterium]